MKKIILVIIGLISLFAIQLASAQCFQNVWYNGRKVTYCVGNNSYDYYYTSTTSGYQTFQVPVGSYIPYGTDSNNRLGYTDYYSNYRRNSEYCDYNYCDRGNKTDEENYYTMLELNGLSSGSSSKADYFKENISGKDVEIERLNAINLKSFAFRYGSNTKKYNDAKAYLNALKNKVTDYYLNGKISRDKMYTIINDLDDLVYNLNEQFANTKSYDTTGNAFYKGLAQENADVVNTSYNRLRATLEN